MIISQDVIEMPKANITIPVSLDDGNVVIVECAKYSKICDLGRFVQSRGPYVYAGVNKKDSAKRVSLFTNDHFVSVPRLYCLAVATCKNCVARHAQKQK